MNRVATNDALSHIDKHALLLASHIANSSAILLHLNVQVPP
jgi:hypothetical protein